MVDAFMIGWMLLLFEVSTDYVVFLSRACCLYSRLFCSAFNDAVSAAWAIYDFTDSKIIQANLQKIDFAIFLS